MLSLLLPLLLGCSDVLCEELRIHNANEFIEFANNVNEGGDYRGTTIFLDADIDLSGTTLQPIGNENSPNGFSGTFDGQGYTISNLKIASSTNEYGGLFGYSSSSTIKSIVLDSSCSITSTYGTGSENRAYVGGIVGECFGTCTVENSVNMASVTFSGNIDSSTYDSLIIGGIVGKLDAAYPNLVSRTFVENCVNYGSVTHSGKSAKASIGGIVGYSRGSSSRRVAYIKNCLNYGTTTYNGHSTSNPIVGGIVGEIAYSFIDNCVNVGSLSSEGTVLYGNIAGYVTDSSITNSYWSESIGFDAFGETNRNEVTVAKFNDNLELNDTVTVGEYSGNSLIRALNAGSDPIFLYDYSRWIFNKNGNVITFNTDGRKAISLTSKVILLPDLASEGNLRFNGWYTDSTCTTQFTKTEVDSATSLYGKFEGYNKNFIITLNTRGGIDVDPISSLFGSVIDLPSNPSMNNNCSVYYWKDEHGNKYSWKFVTQGRDITLYAVWKCSRISTPEELIDFSNIISSGTNFDGVTTFLDSDIDFTDELSKEFLPITSYSGHYGWVFDGQGHTIRNLKMNTTSSSVGLFGNFDGTVIRNVVIDSSCSFVSHRKGAAYIGGIAGQIDRGNEGCAIENCVNMASITYDENSDNIFYLGGIIGYFYSPDPRIKNCANYGSITYSGTSFSPEIGGIVGKITSTGSEKVYIQNCLNYGTITCAEISSIYVGGIVGSSKNAEIDNCVSAGIIITQGVHNNYCYVGSIIGRVLGDSTTTITHSFWTSSVGCDSINGTGSPLLDTETSLVTLDSDFIGKLNTYTAKNSTWSKWVLSTSGGAVAFKINKSRVVITSKIIILPDLVSSEERSFDGWYSDEAMTAQFSSNEVSTGTTLYSSLCGPEITVTFDANGGSPVEDHMTIGCDRVYGTFPISTTTGYSLEGWYIPENEYSQRKVLSGSFVPVANDHVLYARWVANKYTVTFDFGNGTTVSTVYVYERSSIHFPDDTSREGYIFDWWYKDSSFTERFVDDDVTSDITLYAKYERDSYEEESSHGNLAFGVAPLFSFALALFTF